MLEFLKDLWDELMISYQTRNSFLGSLSTQRDPKLLYRMLENETSMLTDFKNETMELFALIRRKESQFGNILT